LKPQSGKLEGGTVPLLGRASRLTPVPIEPRAIPEENGAVILGKIEKVERVLHII